MPMNHRISAGALVQDQGRVLLVRHHKPGVYDFWVAPGGGVQGGEAIAAAAVRETREETCLLVKVDADEPMYVEEFYSPDTRHCKFWLRATLVGGVLSTAQPGATAEHIVEAAWLGRSELRKLAVFPEVLRGRYWDDLASNVRGLQYLGLRRMEFW